MIIIREQAEQILNEALKAPESKIVANRAIHIQIDSAPPESLPSQVLTDGIAANLGDQDVRLFICDDQDMILLGKDISPKTFSMIEYLSMVWFDQHQLKGGSTLYEKGVNWYHFTSMCDDKLAHLHKKQADESSKIGALKKEEARKAALEQSVPQEQIDTLATRRDAHERFEVMVVEDDPFSRTLVRNSLKKDFNVSQAEDGKSAISTYVRKAPNVMFLDIDLPDASGHDILERILELDPKAFVVMLSGKGDRENVLKAVQNGAKGFVGKPFNKDKLLKYIEMAKHIASDA